MKRPLCKVCLERHYTHEGHAINKPRERLTDAINTVPPAINKSTVPRGVRVEPQPAVDKEPLREAVEAASVGHKTPNRRSREAYNAYMKGYMAKKRRRLHAEVLGYKNE